MGLFRTKPLQNNALKRSEALLRAQKAEKALIDYPFADISPNLVVKINPRAKRMALRVDTKRRAVNLVLPKRASMRRAYEFAIEHKYWIREKIAELPEKIDFTDGTVFPLLGEKITVRIIKKSTLRKTDIQLINKELIVSTNKDDPTSRIKRFIINYAKERLSQLSHEKSALIGKKITEISVKDTTSRWGSCSHDRKLSYSWRLIFAPYDAFDYVVAHEVAHMNVMDHSPAFWIECEKLSKNYSRGKSWMRRHSNELVKYF
jgi:predicted metal-dependent hydrolase